MNIFNFKYGMGYCARGAAMTALCVMTIVNVYGFSASSKQTDDRLMTEKEKYEVLDSVCAVLGESIYDSNVYGMKLDNGYLPGCWNTGERKRILLRISSSGEGICHMPK